MTWSHSPPSPLGTPWPRIHLDAAPLVRVIAQARFAPIMSVSEESFVASFQESIRSQYPQVEREMQQQAVVTSEGLKTAPPVTVWRFRDRESGWQISLAPDFVSLDTDRYTNRDDFLHRLKFLFEVAAETMNPGPVARLGVRYVDRLTEEGLGEGLRDLVRADLIGPEAVELGEGSLIASFTEAQFETRENHLSAKWGYLPAGVTHDPYVPPSEGQSWVLDLDAFAQDLEPLTGEMADRARVLGDIVYRFFRWAVSDKFLTSYGGAG